MGATKGGTRRSHSDDFRAAVLEECRQFDKSIAGVALKHGLNANKVRTWLSKSKQPPVCHSIVGPASSAALGPVPPQFVPVSIDALPVFEDKCYKPAPAIQLELRRGNSTATVTWPTELASECGAWLREWLR